MIHLYRTPQCSSSPKAIQWFKRYRLDVCVQSIGKISREELITVLASTDKGIPDLLKHTSCLKDDGTTRFQLLNTMTLNQAINYIKINPALLKSPIIIDKNKVLIGYNPEQIRMFLPKDYRRNVLARNRKDKYGKYNGLL